VRNLTEFGAFVEITDGIDGLIHVSDMSWTKRVKHPSEVLKKGDVVRARITNIDVENQRVSLSIKEFMPNEWDEFARQHKVGDVLSGRIVNVTDFGLFIDIYNGLEGLAHVSEIDVPSGVKLEDRFAVGDYVRTRILRIEEDEKKVGLSMRGVTQPTPNEVSEMKAEAAARRHSAAAIAASAAGQAGALETSHQESEADAEPEAEHAGAGEAGEEHPQPAPKAQKGSAQSAAAGASGAAETSRGKRREGKKQQEEQAGSSE
jgi:small subunit ribosomal protein S1